MKERKIYKVKPGNFKNLKSHRETLSHPDENEVQVEIRAIGLNFADVFCVLGLYSAAPKSTFTPGLEYAGLVVATGTAVKNIKVGDRVMGVTRFGAFTSLLNIDHQYVIPLPEGWTFAEGSGYLVQVLTAYYGLISLGNLSPGQNVLVHSAAGGVGIWANRICKQKGCFTIGTVGSRHKLDLLEQEGYDRSLVRNLATFEKDLEKVMEGRPLHLIMESIGGKIFRIGYRMLAPMGRIVVFGSAHYGERTDRPNYLKLIWKYLNRPRIDPQNMISENKSVMAFNLIYLFEHADIMHDMLSELSGMDLGKPVIGKTYTFDQLPDALREFQGGKTTGKLVVEL